MNARLAWFAGGLSVALLTAQSVPALAQNNAVAPAAQDGLEVLTRGPLHEAFAEPATQEPMAGVLINQQPPNPLEEMPPEAKPEGDAEWIPGYWAWDDERNGFIWVSGAWRVMPEGHRWVPGYWAEVDNGYQWVAGFWASDQVEQVSYLPAPPESQEYGPSSPAPSADHFWVPGNWAWRNTDYMWAPGSWARLQPNWVWVPARYCWSPSGYVYVAGYWDYPIARRGWLFAPVYFGSPLYSQPNYSFTPTVVVNPALLTVNLFVRPRWGWYYFGDYYAPTYRDYTPWFRYGAGNYDPIFAHQRWSNSRRNPNWLADVQRDFARRQRDEAARPPRVFSQTTNITNVNNQIAVSLNNFISQDGLRNQVQRLERGQRNELAQRARDLQRFQAQRQRVELAAGRASQLNVPQQNVKLRLPEIDRSRTTAGAARSPRTLQVPPDLGHRTPPVNPSRTAGQVSSGPTADGERQPKTRTRELDQPRVGVDGSRGRSNGDVPRRRVVGRAPNDAAAPGVVPKQPNAVDPTPRASRGRGPTPKQGGIVTGDAPGPSGQSPRRLDQPSRGVRQAPPNVDRVPRTLQQPSGQQLPEQQLRGRRLDSSRPGPDGIRNVPRQQINQLPAGRAPADVAPDATRGRQRIRTDRPTQSPQLPPQGGPAPGLNQLRARQLPAPGTSIPPDARVRSQRNPNVRTFAPQGGGPAPRVRQSGPMPTNPPRVNPQGPAGQPPPAQRQLRAPGGAGRGANVQRREAFRSGGNPPLNAPARQQPGPRDLDRGRSSGSLRSGSAPNLTGPGAGRALRTPTINRDSLEGTRNRAGALGRRGAGDRPLGGRDVLGGANQGPLRNSALEQMGIGPNANLQPQGPGGRTGGVGQNSLNQPLRQGGIKSALQPGQPALGPRGSGTVGTSGLQSTIPGSGLGGVGGNSGGGTPGTTGTSGAGSSGSASP